jgi:hypothetical protein
MANLESIGSPIPKAYMVQVGKVHRSLTEANTTEALEKPEPLEFLSIEELLHFSTNWYSWSA